MQVYYFVFFFFGFIHIEYASAATKRAVSTGVWEKTSTPTQQFEMSYKMF